MEESAYRNPDVRSSVNSWEVHVAEEVEFLGSSWVLLPTVYPMQRVRSTEFFWRSLKDLEAVPQFLEVGCGAGAMSVLALQHGLCRFATAIDINPNAVENTKINADRHAVSGELRVLESDLFGALDVDDRFDLIFWNSPGVLTEDDVPLSNHERSVFDPDYVTHSRYFSEGPAYLTETGRMLLGFCGAGDRDLIERKAAEASLSVIVLAEDNGGSHPHWLFELRPCVS